MKFLVDAQLPPLLCDILEKAGFESTHVENLPTGDESSDKEISQYADKHELIVITKDLDFHYSHMIIGEPKRLLLITTGNIKNKDLFNIIRNNVLNLKNLFDNCDYVELNNDGLIGHER
jgi:predicted nuclease of predicted toxin-antitoxin system